MKNFVAVAGNIGAGKSSLAALLAQKFGWEAFFEPVEENPYLADFYVDMSRWGFHSQVFFLARRLRHYRGMLARPGSVIQDRSVYEDAEIFARNLHRRGAMSEREWIGGYSLCPVLTIVTDDLDFAHEPAHLDQIARRITDSLHG